MAITTITNKFCNIRFDRKDEYGDNSTSKWWYVLPPYLSGEVAVGDTVACKYDGELLFGTVEELAPVCKYGGHQVLTVVDKVDIARFEAHLAEEQRKKLLLEKMEEVAQLKAKLDGYDEAAKADPELAALLAEYRGEEAGSGEKLEEFDPERFMLADESIL